MDTGYQEMMYECTRLEYELKQVYSQAEKELQEKIEKYYKDFARLDTKKLQQVSDGLLSDEEYKRWRKNKIMSGKVWEQRKDVISRDLYEVNYKARNMVYDDLPDVYAKAHNFATYQIEKSARVDTSYVLYNREAVEQLVADNPSLIPYQKLNMAKDISWNKKNLQSVMLQAVLQGESIPNIAKRLSKQVVQKNRASAVRNARTMATSTYNGGKMDAFKRAKRLGVDMRLRWRATFDGRTRDSHRRLDNETVEVGEPFSNGLLFPCDMSFLDGGKTSVQSFGILCRETYNCRCTIQGVVKGLEPKAEKYRVSGIRGLTYEDWKKGKNTPQMRPKAQPKHKAEKKAETLKITGFAEERAEKMRKIAENLLNEYNSPLTTIMQNNKGTEAGFVGLGERNIMYLKGAKPEALIHEFAHTMAISKEDKLGLSDNKAFWSEIRKVRTRYNKETALHQSLSISSYAKESIDEFYAEAFTLAKMKEMGLPTP